MKTAYIFWACLVAAGPLFAAGAPNAAAARKEEANACMPCHSLRLIHIQRLSKAAWSKELDKMARWGAVIPDRQLLLDYLSEQYSDKQPAADLELTGNGSKQSP